MVTAGQRVRAYGTSVNHPAHLLLDGDAVVVALDNAMRGLHRPEFFKSETSLGDGLRQQKEALGELRLHAVVHVEDALHDDDGAAQPGAHVPPAVGLVHGNVARQQVSDQPRHRHRLVHHLPRQARCVQLAHALPQRPAPRVLLPRAAAEAAVCVALKTESMWRSYDFYVNSSDALRHARGHVIQEEEEEEEEPRQQTGFPVAGAATSCQQLHTASHVTKKLPKINIFKRHPLSHAVQVAVAVTCDCDRSAPEARLVPPPPSSFPLRHPSSTCRRRKASPLTLPATKAEPQQRRPSTQCSQRTLGRGRKGTLLHGMDKIGAAAEAPEASAT
jgi:hypothetical protein